LPEWTFDRKCISANSNLNLNRNSHPNPNPNPNSNPNPKAQKPFWENEMMSFFGQVSRYRTIYIPNIVSLVKTWSKSFL